MSEHNWAMEHAFPDINDEPPWIQSILTREISHHVCMDGGRRSYGVTFCSLACYRAFEF